MDETPDVTKHKDQEEEVGGWSPPPMGVQPEASNPLVQTDPSSSSRSPLTFTHGFEPTHPLKVSIETMQ